MSDFRKPFEYEEEKGPTGFLMLYVIMVVVGEILLGATTMFQCQRALRGVPSAGASVIGAGSAYLLLIIASAAALRKSFRLGVILSKVFLILRVLLLVPAYVFLFVSPLRLPIIALDLESPAALFMIHLAVPIAYVAVFSAAWYAYFLMSKRVRKMLDAAARKKV